MGSLFFAKIDLLSTWALCLQSAMNNVQTLMVLHAAAMAI